MNFSQKCFHVFEMMKRFIEKNEVISVFRQWIGMYVFHNKMHVAQSLIGSCLNCFLNQPLGKVEASDIPMRIHSGETDLVTANARADSKHSDSLPSGNDSFRQVGFVGHLFIARNQAVTPFLHHRNHRPSVHPDVSFVETALRPAFPRRRQFAQQERKPPLHTLQINVTKIL